MGSRGRGGRSLGEGESWGLGPAGLGSNPRSGCGTWGEFPVPSELRSWGKC